MRPLTGNRLGPWWIVGVSIAGLLVAMAVSGIVGLALNRSVEEVTARAVRYDVELEDRGDDLRVAILDLRHYHRNIVFGGRSAGQERAWRQQYNQLLREIDEIGRLGVRDSRVDAAALRSLAEVYRREFEPAIALHPEAGGDPAAFDRRSDFGLITLGRLEQRAAVIDRLGEERAAAALRRIDETTVNAKLALAAVLGGLVLVGTALSYAAARGMKEVSRAYVREQAASEQLSLALKAKTDFIADASHELRTPLTVLRGNAEVGLDLEPDCLHHEILEEIVSEAARMTRLVEDLLLLARSDSGSLPLRMRELPVARLLSGVGEPARMLAQQRGATLAVRLEGAGEIRADATRIEQVVLILVDNAAKYGARGGEIVLRSTTECGELCLEVADRGPGIPPEHMPMIFERFYRVDKARARKHGGAGLGLSIARTIVEAHGGSISARSRPGAETIMRVLLPLLGDDQQRRADSSDPGTPETVLEGAAGRPGA
jgi:signal transduction histidine kinase